MAEPIPAPPPEVPVTIVPALWTLTKLSGTFVVLGLLAALRAFVDAMHGFVHSLVGGIPLIGSLFDATTGKLMQGVSNKLGTWMLDLDPAAGGFFLAISTITAELAQGQVDAAFWDFVHAKKFSGANDPATINKRVTKAINKASAAVATANSGITTRTHDQRVTVAKAKAVAHTQSIGLAGELDHVIDLDIPRLKARTKHVEDSLQKAWDWIRARPVTIAEGVAVGALAVALSRLGIGWIRCRNWKNAGRRVCGMNTSLLDALLTGTLAVLGTVSLVEMANEMIDLEGEIVNTMSGLFRELHDVPRRTAREQGF